MQPHFAYLAAPCLVMLDESDEGPPEGLKALGGGDFATVLSSR